MKKIFLGIIAVFSAVMLNFVSCSGDTEKETVYVDKPVEVPVEVPVEIPVEIQPTYLTVTFDSNGGSKVESQNIVSGKKAVEPKSPTKQNCEFDGWYSASDIGNGVAYNFSSVVSENITLYAKWKNITDAPDVTAPSLVQTLTATSKDTGIELTWTDPSDEDLWGFVIGYYENSSSRALVFDNSEHEFVVGKSSNVDKSNKTFVGNLTDKKSYIFYIKSVDENFNISEARESASCTYNEKFVEVEVPIEVEKKLEAGTYTIYHLQQNTTGGKAFANYTLKDTESNKSVVANSTITELKKTYEGFTAKSLSQNESAIYVFYDRNTITYTFQTGTEGKFEDGTTSKEVKGLYGASYSKPKQPIADDYNFVKWQDAAENSAPLRFEAESKTFNAVWRNKSEGPVIPEGFVKVDGVFISGEETWTPSSEVFVSGREITIPDLIVCDHEVTRGEFKDVMGTDPSTAKAYNANGTELTGDDVLNNPVNYVNRYAAIAYCNKLSIKENLTPCYTVSGVTDWETLAYSSIPTSSNGDWSNATCNFEADGYRLPTEAEWEWLARGGENYEYAGSDEVGDVAWCSSNTNDTGSREVKTKQANGYGLYDMSGNVWELCWDWYGSISSTTAATGVVYSYYRVIRGGSWNEDYFYCAVAYRRSQSLGTRYNNTGFRVVRSSSN